LTKTVRFAKQDNEMCVYATNGKHQNHKWNMNVRTIRNPNKQTGTKKTLCVLRLDQLMGCFRP